jgi:hypothetical protein
MSRPASSMRRPASFAELGTGRRVRHSPREELDFCADEQESVCDPRGSVLDRRTAGRRPGKGFVPISSVAHTGSAGLPAAAVSHCAGRRGRAVLRRAAEAHGEHEERTGQVDSDWPDWCALYMVRERAGEEPPA